MDKKELKQKALTLVSIPDHYETIIEECMVEENGEGEAFFTWANKEREEGISVTLDLDGNLLKLSIDKKMVEEIRPSLDIQERKELAEQFLLTHHPEALTSLTYHRSENRSRAVRFYYEQIVMDLPLPSAGCFIDVTAKGEIVTFSLDGIKSNPKIPEKFIQKQKLFHDVTSRLSFNLLITKLYKNLYEVEKDRLYMVYEPEPFMEYVVDAVEPTLSTIHEEEEKVYTPLPKIETTRFERSTIEEIVGITDNMEMIRKVDLGEETGMVWRDRDWENETNSRSVDGFFHNQNDGTVKAFVTESGDVRSFMWFAERTGEKSLNRDECFQITLDFLQSMIPEYMPYLNVKMTSDDGDEMSDKEHFLFRVHNGHGITFQTEIVTVAINRTTGRVDYYSGPRASVEELEELPLEPRYSEERVKEKFLEHLDFDLAWTRDYEEEDGSYKLVYKPCDRQSRRKVRFIDALTGEVILDKEDD
ncbi:YcdB/YcdC domain-containing protein [Radiobacillus deserti]|uniref:DUF4901 domain-containing protein n=1 Tax=Radiobacillus deserti TaxID=2594883 RepID=A0A516KI89_9BACI|nr:YcdB/YcdC domain-containing protein [Radiobacillus deserti]QDP41099.1 DUF4901 domain-containing protein [Radiobacillus deserti]